MPCARPMQIIRPTTSFLSTCMHELSIVAQNIKVAFMPTIITTIHVTIVHELVVIVPPRCSLMNQG